MTTLAARGISKRFGGVRALEAVDFEVSAGELVAVVGENGAGKSTCMKILAGVLRPDAGHLEVDGRSVVFRNVVDAGKAGIALIHQELELCDNLTVADNVVLGDEPRRFGFLDARRALERARLALTSVGLDIDPRTPLQELSIGHRQLVEIAKALARNARVLILDEPTSSLSRGETEVLFETLERLRRSGTALVYISHRLSEVERLADRVVVLRDGRLAGSLARHELEGDRLLTMMLGAAPAAHARGLRRPPGAEPALEVRDVGTRLHARARVSLQVASGEVVGLAGLVGAGRTELLRAIFGIDEREGQVVVHGREVAPRDPRAMQRSGVAYLPEDRKHEGLLLTASLRENLSLAALPRWSRFGFLRSGAITRYATLACEELRIKNDAISRPVADLSGGNQQKVVLGKCLALEPSVLLLDEPTRGVDVGAKREIWERIRALARQGLAVLVVSSEFEELAALADRVVVLSRGAVAVELQHVQLDEATILDYAAR